MMAASYIRANAPCVSHLTADREVLTKNETATLSGRDAGLRKTNQSVTRFPAAHCTQFAPAAGTLISVGRMIAAAITSRHNPAKACSMVTKPPC